MFVSDSLAPGTQCPIPEEEWFAFLERHEPLHQWGGAFLHEEEPGGLVRVYVRLDVGRREFRCLRLDAPASARAREGVRAIEEASRRAADLVTALQRQGHASVAELGEQEHASAALVRTAETVYRELLGGAAPGA